MAVELISNCVVVPHQHNWKSSRPKWKRRWATALGEGVTGAEDRQALRGTPRESMNWNVLPYNLQERARLIDRVKAALKLGKAVAPRWGRGQVLAADVTGTSVNLTGTDWPWLNGEWIYFCDRAQLGVEAWDIRQIVSAAGAPNYTLGSAVSRTYKAGDLCWPLMFGKLTCNDLSALTNHHAEVPLMLEQPAGVGAFATPNCPPEQPDWFVGEPPADFCAESGWELALPNSVYAVGMGLEFNPNDVLTLEQVDAAVTIWAIEFQDWLDSISTDYYVRHIGAPFWYWWTGTPVMRKSLLHKIDSGVLDPNDPTGDFLVLFSQHYWLAQPVCLEAKP